MLSKHRLIYIKYNSESIDDSSIHSNHFIAQVYGWSRSKHNLKELYCIVTYEIKLFDIMVSSFFFYLRQDQSGIKLGMKNPIESISTPVSSKNNELTSTKGQGKQKQLLPIIAERIDLVWRKLSKRRSAGRNLLFLSIARFAQKAPTTAGMNIYRWLLGYTDRRQSMIVRRLPERNAGESRGFLFYSRQLLWNYSNTCHSRLLSFRISSKQKSQNDVRARPISFFVNSLNAS